jgi:phage terminase large subunit-like protein
VDELHAFKDASVYEAMRTALIKRPESRMVVITTAGQGAESPLGRLRTRALSQPHVKRAGAVTEAQGPSLAMLEWAVEDEVELTDKAVKAANPASWLTVDALAEQRESVADLGFRRYHCNIWTSVESAWLPAGAWQACAGDATIERGERVWVGVDVGGERSASAVVWVTEDLRVGCKVFQGDEAVLAVGEFVRELAGTFEMVELVHDPWRAQQLALELEREGMTVVSFPQSGARMIPASARLHSAVVERRLTHPNDAELNRHVTSAVARDTPRGWRLDKSHRQAQVDGVVALAMAVERAEHKAEPVRLLGWI